MSTVGFFIGALFFAFSLTPSLLPRTFAFQGVVSGISLALGYALGAWGRGLWSYLELPVPRVRVQRMLTLMAGATAGVVVVAVLWATAWQNSVRILMGLPEVSGVQPFSVTLIALLVFGGGLVVSRLSRRVFRVLSRGLRWFLPPRAAHVLGAIGAVAVFWAVVDGIIFTLTLRVADESYERVEAILPDELNPPADPMKTGSPAFASLLA